MHFTKSFSRSKGGGAFPALGSDGAAGAQPASEPTPASDNHVGIRSASTVGSPTTKIAIAYSAPPGSSTVSAELWFYERATLRWYRVGAPISLTPDEVLLVDALPLTVSVDAGAGSSMDVALVVQDNEGALNGDHTFALAGVMGAG